MSGNISIKGGRELDELLKTLPVKLQNNIMRAALRAGANVYAKKTKENVPVKLGDLRKSVRVTTRVKAGVVTAAVKVGNKKAWYGPLVEFGTRPHKIKAKDAKGLTIGDAVVKEVDHPGAEPHPFMRPAADESHAEAVDAVVKTVRMRLTRNGLNVPMLEQP